MINSQINAKTKYKDDGLMALDNGIVVDLKNNLMWASKDNGYSVNWQEAKDYCRSLRLGGYHDWRLPTIQELETLFTPKQSNPKPPTSGCDGAYNIHPFFHITCCCPWAAENKYQRPASFPFNIRERFWHHQTKQTGNRALPVRMLKSATSESDCVIEK